MEALRKRYSDQKEEVLNALQLTNDLLALLTREGLLDIADCVRYQGMADMRKRTQAFLEMLIERRTERAYRVLIQGLRETGQAKAADLLTDMEEETNLIIQLQKMLDERIESIDGFVQNELDRVGLESKARVERKGKLEKKPCGHPKKTAPMDSRKKPNREEEIAEQTKNSAIWQDAQESMRRAAEQLERCKIVIGKLNLDCHAASESHANLIAHTKECYIQLSKMIRPSQKHVQIDAQKSSLSPDELFERLVEEVHCLMTRERRAQEREIEGRSNAMRTLRQLRDWMIDRAGILTSLHSTFRPLGNPRFKSPYTAYTTSTPKLTSQHHSSNQHLILPDQSESIHFHEPSNEDVSESPISQDHVSSIGGKKALLPVPFATSTPRPSESGSRGNPMEIPPISTLVEGVNILEKQLREYIHLEILLTDKFRFEMRMKQHQQKAQGFSHQGINEARSVLGKISLSNDNTGQEAIYRLKTQLEQINTEYDQCRNYMDKVIGSLTQVDDVENFLKSLNDKEKQYKKDANKPEKKPKGRRMKGGEVVDSYTALVEMLKTNPKSQNSKLLKSREQLRLPSINKSNDTTTNREDLLTKFKVLVANFEIVRLRMMTVEDRFRRELSRKERKFESIIRSKDDDIYRLQTLLNEAEAEKEKYLRLYNSTKLSTSRKK